MFPDAVAVKEVLLLPQYTGIFVAVLDKYFCFVWRNCGTNLCTGAVSGGHGLFCRVYVWSQSIVIFRYFHFIHIKFHFSTSVEPRMTPPKPLISDAQVISCCVGKESKS